MDQKQLIEALTGLAISQQEKKGKKKVIKDMDDIKVGMKEEEGPSSTSRPGPNPLYVHVVLGKIFENLRDEDLLSCRLVCRMWKSVSDKEKNHRKFLSIEGPEDLGPTLKRLKKEKGRRVVSELGLHGVRLDDPKVEKIIDLVLPTLSTLAIDQCKVKGQEDFRNFMRKVCPNLIKMSLGTVKNLHGFYFRYFPIPDIECHSEDDMEMEDSDSDWEEEPHQLIPMIFPKMRWLEYLCIFSDVGYMWEATKLSAVCEAFPNIRTLMICNMYDEKPDRLSKYKLPFLKSLKVHMMPHLDASESQKHDKVVNSCPCCIKEQEKGDVPLWIRRNEGGLKERHVKALMNLDLKLEVLTLVNLNHRVNPELLQKFLLSQSATLKELNLEQTGMDPTEKYLKPCPSPLPIQLPNVESLKIHKPYVRNFNHIFSSFPNAKFVKLECGDWGPTFPGRIAAAPNLYSLNIESIEPKYIIKMTPLLETLMGLEIKSQCNDEILRIIFTKAANLRALILNEDGCRITASGLTGLKQRDILRLNSQKNQCKKALSKTIKSLRGDRPFVGSLEDLEYLSLHVNDGSMLEAFAKYAVPFCPSLVILLISGEGKSEKIIPNELSELFEKQGFYSSILQDDDKTETSLFVKANSNLGKTFEKFVDY